MPLLSDSDLTAQPQQLAHVSGRMLRGLARACDAARQRLLPDGTAHSSWRICAAACSASVRCHPSATQTRRQSRHRPAYGSLVYGSQRA